MPLPARILAAVVVMAAAAPALAQGNISTEALTKTGPATVLESDTLAIGDTVFSLYGVDGPWQIQNCLLDGQNWACGPVAMRGLEVIVQDSPVTCTRVPDNSLRRRAIIYGHCEIGGVDISAEMVRQGFVMAFPEQSTDYVELEAAAKAAKAGLWKADVFEPPSVWEYRQRTE